MTFGLWSNEVAPGPMVGGAFVYAAPAGLTPTGFTDSQYCDATMTLSGQTLTVTDVGLPVGWTCSLVLHLQASSSEAVYDLSAATLTYTGPGGGGSFEMAPGSVATLHVTNAPTISSLNPSSGPEAGGTSVRIHGDRFTGVSQVTVGGVPVGFTVNRANSITILTPAFAAGSKDVVVTAHGGASAISSNSKFSYSAPIPTLTEWAMIGFAVILGGVGLAATRRRRMV